MVTYGPWEQGGDYERPFGGLYKQGTAQQSTSHYDFFGGGAPFDDEMNTALGRLPGPPSSFAAQPSARMAVTATQGGPGHPDGSLDVKQNEGAAEWTAAQLLDVSYYYATYLAPLRPAAAVGIEYDGAVVPVGADLQIVMIDSTTDSTSSSNTPANAALDISLEAYTPGGDGGGSALVTYRAAVGTRPHDFRLNLSSDMGSKGEVGLHVFLKKKEEWHYADPNQLGVISVGTGVDTVQMTYTLHPPRHRWIYNALPTLPALRQFPRDDALGTGSAARHWPPPSSQQGGLRQLGYY